MATARRTRGRKNRQLGLALAGGGPGGAVYEVGALRALEEAIEGLDFTQCHVYVGVSAGAFIAAALANGVTPTRLVRTLVADEAEDHPFDPAGFVVPAYREWARRAARLPALVANAAMKVGRCPNEQALIESIAGLSRALPLGIFDNEPIRHYLEEAFSANGRTDDFRRLRHRLFVVSADLESGQPIVFGSRGWDHVPISRAVQASTALPGLYPPVEIDGHLCTDGVLLKTVHASVALEHGADLLLCINPLVPVDVATGQRRGALKPGSILQQGLPALLSQTFRTLIHSRMVVGMARYRAHFPDADVVLFEPDRDEYGLFFRNIFSFKSRREVCEIGYRATRHDLLRRHALMDSALRRHGCRLRLDVLRNPDRDVGVGVGLVRRGGRRSRVVDQLSGTLAELEGALS
jgi:predicted acylesterase/phospholipase RssA